MRQIRQPGPAASERVIAIEASGQAFSFMLERGLTFLEAVRRGFAQAGFASGVLNCSGGALGPLAYVMPALSTTGDNAAFYSQTFRPAGVTCLETAAMTFGTRDGAPFFHCHALWREADGRRNGGHILPDETIVAQQFEVQAMGIDGAGFLAETDAETNFKLFGPVVRPHGTAEAPARIFALRLRPNQDFCTALEDFCRARGIARARLHGGVGSIIGARFAGGRISEPFATEIALTAGVVAPDAKGALCADVDIALVDYTGGIATGRLRRGDNPVLMTMELVLEAL